MHSWPYGWQHKACRAADCKLPCLQMGRNRQRVWEVDDPVATRWLQLSDEGAKTDGWSGYL